MGDVPLKPCANCGVPYPEDVFRCPRCGGNNERVQAHFSESEFSIRFEPIPEDDRSARWRRSLRGTKYEPDGKTTAVGPRWVSEELQQELPIVDARRPLIPRPLDTEGDSPPDGSASLPEYLGLALDRERLTLKCGSKTADIRGGITLAIVEKLIQSRDRFVHPTILRGVWADDDRVPDDKTINNRMSEVRRILKPLGLNVENVSGNGYRLVELTGGTKQGINREADREVNTF